MEIVTLFRRTAWICCLLLCAAGVRAATAPDDTPSADAERERLDAIITQIETLRPAVLNLAERYDGLDDSDLMARTVTDARLNRTFSALVSQIHSAARIVLNLGDSGVDVSEDRSAVANALVLVPDVAFATIDRLQGELELPNEAQPAAEQAAAYARVRITVDRIDALFDVVLENLELQQRFGLDVSGFERELDARLEERAATTSGFLDVASSDVDALQAQLAALPSDTDLIARLAVARQRVSLSADVLRGVVAQMKARDLATALYETQLISVTGELTTDVFDFAVLRDLVAAAWAKTFDWLGEHGAGLVFSLLVFLAIVFVTFKAAAIVQHLVTSALERSHVRLSELLKRMIVSTTRGVIIAVGLLLGLSQLGISLGPLLAGLGIAGFVIGFALQDTLSNFASGLMILFYRPFDVGDVVEAGGVFGKVSHMSLVNTTILTFDNQTLIIPNSKIWGDVIKNLNSQTVRRVDMMFGIGYGDDVPRAEKVLDEIVQTCGKVLDDPEPVIRLHELGESSVNFVVRPWVRTEDYWDVYWHVTREVKMRFDAEGITIPFPQRDVHFYAESPPVSPRSEAAAEA
jgi:small conductance mechanosensitive channel